MSIFKRRKDVIVETQPESMPEVKPDVKEMLRDIVENGWREVEDASNSETYDEVFERFVDEAVILINSVWQSNARYVVSQQPRKASVEIRALYVFGVTKNLDVYTSKGYKTENPVTKHSCLYGRLQLRSSDEEKRFVSEILKKLPEGTRVEKINLGKDEDAKREYSFKIKVNMEN